MLPMAVAADGSAAGRASTQPRGYNVHNVMTGLDVLVDLEPPTDHPLVALDNVIVTPHTAFFSQEAVLELEERAAGEVAKVLRGEMPDNPVNPEVLSHSRATIQRT